MLKAFFIDFYGTIVHEDGEIISNIVQEIYDTGDATNNSEITSYWWDKFKKLCLESYGNNFNTQRNLEYQSLLQTIHRFSSTADVDRMSNMMFEYWMNPPIFEDAKAYKPRKEMFDFVLKNTGLSCNDVIHIGDSLSSDIKGASSVGIKSIWINRSGRSVPQGIKSVRNLPEIINERW